MRYMCCRHRSTTDNIGYAMQHPSDRFTSDFPALTRPAWPPWTFLVALGRHPALDAQMSPACREVVEVHVGQSEVSQPWSTSRAGLIGRLGDGD